MPRKKEGTPERAAEARIEIARAQPGRKVSPEDVTLIVASEESVSVLAERYGCSEALIYRYRRRARGGVSVARRDSIAARENDPARGQTLETIYANCEEEGDCQIWKGSMDGHRNLTPMLFHAGKMHKVRDVVAHLSSHIFAGRNGVWGTCCETPGCVAHEHLVFRSRSLHLKHKVKSLPKAVLQLRNLKIAQAKERKIPLEDIPLIKASKEPTKVLADRYHCSERLIRRYRAKQHAAAPASPWAGL